MNRHPRRRLPRPAIFASLLIALAAIAPAAQAKPPASEFFGLQTAGMLSNPGPYTLDETAAMQSLGIKTVRLSIPWHQPNDGVCGGAATGAINWAPLDAVLLGAAQKGITALGNLGPRRLGGSCLGYQTPATETEPGTEYDDWYKPGGYVTQLVQRYGVGGSF